MPTSPRKAPNDDRVVQIAYEAHVTARLLGEHKPEPFGNYQQMVATLRVGYIVIRLTNPDRTRKGHYRAVEVRLKDLQLLHVSGLYQHWPKQVHCERILQYPGIIHTMSKLFEEATRKEAEAHSAPAPPPTEIHIERPAVFVPDSISDGGASVRLMHPDGSVQTIHATEILDLVS